MFDSPGVEALDVFFRLDIDVIDVEASFSFTFFPLAEAVPELAPVG